MKKRILDGSLEVVDSFVQGGVIDEDSKTLRYVRGSTRKAQPSESVKEYLFRIYDNSTGSLASGDFNDNGVFQ